MNKLKTYIRAGYAALQCVTYEEDRVAAEIVEACKDINGEKYTAWEWTITRGLISTDGKVKDKTADPIAALATFYKWDLDGETKQPMGIEIPNKSIVILRDFHLILKGGNPILIRWMKDCISIGRATNRHLVIIGCQLHLPPELEKEITVIEYGLPTKEELLVQAKTLAEDNGKELNGNTDDILSAGSGLTTTEFSDAVSKAIVETGQVDPAVISEIKAETIKKNGILEVVTQKVTLDDIGGLDLLKAKLYSQRNLFSPEAKEYGLPSPRPLLTVGQAGTGKSLTASATQSIFRMPLLRLEAGRIFGGVVGESERNWRTAFATAKAIAPCIVHIDEIDGLFSGGESSGRTDGGTTSRVIKAILQDLQFNSDGMFFVFTANDIDMLPDPLIDRCDVWYVELPYHKERVAIWQVHIAKRNRKPSQFDLSDLASKSDGFSGRQIEQAWIAALTIAFNDNREPTNEDCIVALSKMTPTSKTMADTIAKRRARLQHCASPASTPEDKTVTLGRKIA